MRLPTIVRTLALGVALIGLAPALAWADDEADRRKTAADVLRELHSFEMMSALVPTIIAQVRASLTHDDPDLTKQFDTYAPHLQADADATKPALMEQLVDVYAKTFTLPELTDMLAYYRSPVGQRIIATQATVNRDMLTVARNWGTALARTMKDDAAGDLQGTPQPYPPPDPDFPNGDDPWTSRTSASSRARTASLS